MHDPSSPPGRRQPRPFALYAAAPPPRSPLAGRFAPGGKRTALMEGPLRRSVRAPASLPSCTPDHARSRRSTRTAQALSEHLGWAEIRHPFHPLKGQRFLVLKTRRVSGTETLLLRDAERGSFSIAREWTDWGTPSVHDDAIAPTCYFDLGMLLELIALIDQLAPPRKSSKKGA
jgi:Family of unknown function (DUF5372)